MKRKAINRICAALALLLAATACSRDDGGECLPCQTGRTVDVRLAEALPKGLSTPLWAFRREAGSGQGYVLDRVFAAVADGQTLKLPLEGLQKYDYRLLMVAQPADAAWLTVSTADGAPLAPGDAWETVRLASASGAAASDGYCGFTDVSGAQLLAEGSVRLTLTRVAGQLLFDIFRTAGTLEKPEGVVSDKVASVIDRVSAIEIEYANPTASLRFDADGVLIPASYAAQPLRRTVRPELVDFRVSLPQADKGLDVYDAALRGSLRLAGDFLLPSDAKLRVRMVFTYYDTLPLCGNGHTGAHDASCYGQRQLTLSLPAPDAPAGLPVASDFFTRNRIGLRCDRIIDVPVSGGMTADFDWL